MDAIERAEKEARKLGAEHGKAAASWLDITYGNAARWLRGIQDGDPEIMDMLPHAPLSGEWTDEPTPRDILAAVGQPCSSDDDEPCCAGEDDILFAYQQEYELAAQDEAERRARYYIEG